MPVITIALMGFFAFTGGPAAAPEAATTAVSGAEESVTILARNEAATIARASGNETRTVKLTAYNAVPEQTDEDPFTTASGAYSNPEVIAAVSRDLWGTVMPKGTVVALEYSGTSATCGFDKVEHLVGYRVVADTMHQRWSNKMDLLFDQDDKVMIAVNGKPAEMTNPAKALGVCTVSVRIIGTIDIKDIPDTQEELRRIVEGDRLAMR